MEAGSNAQQEPTLLDKANAIKTRISTQVEGAEDIYSAFSAQLPIYKWSIDQWESSLGRFLAASTIPPFELTSDGPTLRLRVALTPEVSHVLRSNPELVAQILNQDSETKYSVNANSVSKSTVEKGISFEQPVAHFELIGVYNWLEVTLATNPTDQSEVNELLNLGLNLSRAIITASHAVRGLLPEETNLSIKVNKTFANSLPRLIQERGTTEIPLGSLALDDIKAQPEASEAFRGLVRQIGHKAALKEYGLLPDRLLILHGPPGNGKSSLVLAVAAATGAPLLVRKGAELMPASFEQEILGTNSTGALEAALQKVDALAKNSSTGHAFFVIEEGESFLIPSPQVRDETKGHISRMEILKNYLEGLTKKSNVTIIIIARSIAGMDEGLKSRAQKVLELNKPDEIGIFEILSGIVERKNRVGTKLKITDLDDLPGLRTCKALVGLSGRGLEEIVSTLIKSKIENGGTDSVEFHVSEILKYAQENENYSEQLEN